MEYNFFIPSYQRGYRWTEKEVNYLLNDIAAFKSEPIKDTDRKTWYCLQPLVIRKCDKDTGNEEEIDLSENWYEVIDGQQRLTTIYLILHYLNQSYIESRRINLFKLNYATRRNSQIFLEKDLNEEVIDDSNIDFHHISVAYKTIHKWFLNKGNKFDTNEFSSKFSFFTNVIWYEVNDGSDSYDIFTRLNIGKIQLTNAELIKALFLKKWNDKESIDKLRLKQLQIASEWDRIENTLRNDSFWYFIYNKKDGDIPKYANRIEFIFDLMKDKKEGTEEKYTFYKFNDAFEKSKNESRNKIPDTDKIWLEIKNYFLTFEEWFKDRELYHLIGFLVAIDCNVQDLIKSKINRNKTEFKQFLIEEIKGKVKCDITKLEYGNNKIKTILLLFNIQTILANDKSNMRFPFNLFKNEDWDIEHVRSQTDKNILGKDRKEWARDILEYFTGEVEKAEQEIFIATLASEEMEKTLSDLSDIVYSGIISDKKFNELYIFICKKFKENSEPNKCAISNLALLDAATNRSYKNAFFPIKRKIILENDKSGTFIPLCTRNIFMKAYSKRFDEIMYWNKYDADEYLSVINETLKVYLN